MSFRSERSPSTSIEWIESNPVPSEWPLDLHGPVDREFVPFRDESKSRSIADLLKEIVDRYPDRLALIDAKSQLTYRELWSEVDAWAARVADICPEELVGIVAPASRELAIGMLACFAAGRAFVAIDPHNPPEWIAGAVRRTRPSLLLTFGLDEHIAASLYDVPCVVSLSKTPPAREWSATHVTSDSPACVLFTSGSTGDPKGIVNSQRNLLQRVSQSINAAHINCDDRFLTLASLCTIVGVRDLLTALLAGASMVLLDAHTGASDVLRAIDESRISILFSFPALLRSIVRGSRNRAPDELRLVRIGGDTTLWGDISLLRAWLSRESHIQLIYAATEAPMMQWFVHGEGEGKIPIGYPLPGNALAVLDEQGNATPDGEIGELIVRSCYVALGEWSNGLAKMDTIDLDPIDGSLRILRTGDLVRRRADGFFDRVGRKDRQVKVRGVRVELDGVEAAIRRHRSVHDVAVVARSDEESTRLIAYIEARDVESDALIADLRELLGRTVAPQMQPSLYYLVHSVPRLANSKLDVPALQAMDAVKKETERASLLLGVLAEERTVTPLENVVSAAWQKVLGVAPIRSNDDFFELGGDSLRAISLIVELEKVLEREIPLTLINDAPTLSAFCSALVRETKAAYSPLVVIKSGRGWPPLFIVHGAGGSVMELFTLGRNLSWSGAVIGVQARGLNDGEQSERTVEAMAETYLIAIRERQPKGPYLLSGYSFGGLVAFEMARRLRASHEEVAFLGLLDTLPPGGHLLRLWTWIAYLMRDLRQRVFGRQAPPLLGWMSNAAVTRARAVAVNALRASAFYKPPPYDGEISFFEPSLRDLGLPSLASGWKRFAASVRQYELQGRHLDMLSGHHAQDTANAISKCLDAATRHNRVDVKLCVEMCGSEDSASKSATALVRI